MEENMKEAVAIRKIVARHWFEQKFANIIEKDAGVVFRVEYHIQKRFDYTEYPENWDEKPKHYYKDEKIYHIIHEATNTEIPIVDGFIRYQPSWGDILQNLVAWGIKNNKVQLE